MRFVAGGEAAEGSSEQTDYGQEYVFDTAAHAVKEHCSGCVGASGRFRTLSYKYAGNRRMVKINKEPGQNDNNNIVYVRYTVNQFDYDYSVLYYLPKLHQKSRYKNN